MLAGCAWVFPTWRDWYRYINALALDDDPHTRDPALYGAKRIGQVDHIVDEPGPEVAIQLLHEDFDGKRTLPRQRTAAVALARYIADTLKTRHTAILALSRDSDDVAKPLQPSYGAAVLRAIPGDVERESWEDAKKGAPSESPLSLDAAIDADIDD